MATSIYNLAVRLEEETAWQKTPLPLDIDDYVRMIERSIKRLYIDTGRASSFHNDMFRPDGEGHREFTADLPIDEEEYVMICAQLQFFQKVATDVNNIVGYTTNALTVTNADKPYANLKDTMDRLERDRRIIYYKMVRFTMTA